RNEMVSPRRRVGVIGLGIMGRPIAMRLLDYGHDVAVLDLEERRALPLVEAGARSGIAAVLEAEVLCVITPDEKPLIEMRDTLSGSSIRTVVLLSTVDPASVADLEARLKGSGVRLVDAPVSGGAGAARAGSLTILASGSTEALDDAAPVLEALGNTRRFARVGAASAVKLANQLALFGALGALFEGLDLTRAFGVPDEEAVAGILASTGRSWGAENLLFFRNLVAEYDEAGTPAEVRPWRKDLRAFAHAASDIGARAEIVNSLGDSFGDRLEAEARRGEEDE